DQGMMEGQAWLRERPVVPRLGDPREHNFTPSRPRHPMTVPLFANRLQRAGDHVLPAPAARTARRTKSASVRSPTSLPWLTTGRQPIFLSSMTWAASASGVSGLVVTGSDVIASLTTNKSRARARACVP